MDSNLHPLTPPTVADVRKALDAYRKVVEASNMTDTSKKTYLLHADHFVRWLEGDFAPGARLA